MAETGIWLEVELTPQVWEDIQETARRLGAPERFVDVDGPRDRGHVVAWVAGACAGVVAAGVLRGERRGTAAS